MTKNLIFKKNNIGPIFVGAFTFLTLNSCSSPESFESKMSRYTPRTAGKNKVPEFKIHEMNFPAKFTEGEKKPTDLNPSAETEKRNVNDLKLSNKKLYFMSLLDQYESFKAMTKKSNLPEVTHCPHFHSNVYDLSKGKVKNSNFNPFNENKQKLVFQYEWEKLKDNSYTSAHPELFLPLSKDDTHPQVIDVINSKGKNVTTEETTQVVYEAIDIHLAKTYSEIRVLCENGMSDNYYIYENLMTHTSGHEFGPTSNNLKTLYKTTLFTNSVLLKSFKENKHELRSKGRGIASVIENNDEDKIQSKQGTYTKEFIQRLNAPWANYYLENF